jgi:hypothetical protein
MTDEPARHKEGLRETYDVVADTVGLVPSLRMKDNVIQGLVIAVVTALAALAGYLTHGTEGLAIGSLLGLIGSLVLSGAVLMVIGWIRTARAVRRSKP